MPDPNNEPAVFSRAIPPQVGDVVQVNGSWLRVVEVGACTIRLDREPEPHVLRPVPPVPHVTLRERARPPAIVSRPGRPTRWRR